MVGGIGAKLAQIMANSKAGMKSASEGAQNAFNSARAGINNMAEDAGHYAKEGMDYARAGAVGAEQMGKKGLAGITAAAKANPMATGAAIGGLGVAIADTEDALNNGASPEEALNMIAEMYGPDVAAQVAQEFGVGY
jgi:hypothetical protein